MLHEISLTPNNRFKATSALTRRIPTLASGECPPGRLFRLADHPRIRRSPGSARPSVSSLASV